MLVKSLTSPPVAFIMKHQADWKWDAILELSENFQIRSGLHWMEWNGLSHIAREREIYQLLNIADKGSVFRPFVRKLGS